MSSFRYKALKSDGAVIEGDFEGNSKGEVLRRLSERGLQPVSVMPVAGRRGKKEKREAK